MKNIALKIQYDGSQYSGWQKQLDQKTVQGEIDKALSIICKQKIQTNGASRTDAKVHAYEQWASFTAEFEIPTENMKKVLNSLLPEDISILSAKEMPESFHARYSTVGKTYVYKIMNTEGKNPFFNNYGYNITEKLDWEKMKEAGKRMEGYKDFRAFMSSGGGQELTKRNLDKVKVWSVDARDGENPNANNKDQKIFVEVTARSFLYNMVRIMVGTLVYVGLGKIKVEEIDSIIKSLDRRNAGPTAPPGGLYLKKICYDEYSFMNEIKE